MAIRLTLRKEEENLVAAFDNQIIRTEWGTLPNIKNLQADPFTEGQALTAALGGDAMLSRLDNDPDNLLLLDCDDAVDAIAWEFATLRDRQFLCVKAGMLRTVDRDAPPVAGDGALNFITLAADPLVDQGGSARDGYRLDIDNEMKIIRATLENCGKSLEARRIPPTREALNKALRRGPAILHLTCHGNVVDANTGKIAILYLEKKDGGHDPLTGVDLMSMPPRGALRLVLLSACMTATGTQANLAKALVNSGVPMSIGMQNPFPDPLSDELAAAFYDSLFAGLPFGEALRQARGSFWRNTFPAWDCRWATWQVTGGKSRCPCAKGLLRWAGWANPGMCGWAGRSNRRARCLGAISNCTRSRGCSMKGTRS